MSALTATAAPRLEMIGGGSSVAVKRAGSTVQLKKGETLLSGDEVITDRATSVDIRFDDKTLVRLGSNSSYRLEEDSTLHSWIHRLAAGVVRVLVPKRDPKPTGVVFRMDTAEGTIGVRGTEFTVTEKAGSTTLKGLDGDVMFGPVGSDFAQESSFVHVKKGFQSVVAKGAKPTAPSSFDLPSYLKELKEKNSPFAALGNRDQALVRARSESAPTTIAPTAETKPVKEKSTAASETPVQAKAPQLSPEEKLFAAADAGNLEAMAAAIRAGANVNKPMLAKATALHVTALKGHVDAAKLLLKAGANVNAKDEDGRTPLMTMVLGNPSEEMANALFEAKPDETLKDADGLTAIDLARQARDAATGKDKEKLQKIVNLLESPD